MDNIKNDIFPFMDVSEFKKTQEVIDFTLQHISDYRFLYYNNVDDADKGQKIQVVRANPVPEDFTYRIQEDQPKQRQPRKPRIDWS